MWGEFVCVELCLSFKEIFFLHKRRQMLLTKNYYLIRALAIENIAKKPSGSIEINEYRWGKKILNILIKSTNISLSLLFYYTQEWLFSEITPAFINALYDYSWILNWITSKSLKYFSCFIMSRFFVAMEKKRVKILKIFYLWHICIFILILSTITHKKQELLRELSI